MSPPSLNNFNRLSPLIPTYTISTRGRLSAALKIGRENNDKTAAKVFHRLEKTPPLQKMEQSTSVGVPITSVAGTVGQGKTNSYQFQVSESSPTRFTLVCGSSNLSLTLINPSGNAINPNTVQNFPGTSYDLTDEEGFNWRIYTINKAAIGTWKLKVKGVSIPAETYQEPFVLAEWGQGAGIAFHASFQNANIHTGDPLIIQAAYTGPGGAILGAQVHADIALPDGTASSLDLVDNGTGGDAMAGDGVYSGTFPATSQTGSYKVMISASSANPKAQRQDFQLATVSASNSALTGTIQDWGEDIDGNGLFENLVISASLNITHQGTYRLFAQLKDQTGIYMIYMIIW